MIKCSKCGTENNNDANFCCGCGASLEEERKVFENENTEYECPKCGNVFKGNPKFCSKCGLQFNWPKGGYDAVPIKRRGVSRSTNNSVSANKVKSIIFAAIAMVIAIFAVIAIWLPFGKLEMPAGSALGTGNEILDIDFWFKTLWESALDGERKYYIGTFILFLGSIIGVIVFAILTFKNAIMTLLNIKNSGFIKYLGLCVAFPTMYFVSALSNNYFIISEAGIKGSIVGGAGYILNLIALIMAICLAFADELFDGIEHKNLNIASIILKYCGVALLTVSLFISFNAVHVFKQNIYLDIVDTLNVSYKMGSYSFNTLARLSFTNITLVMFAFEFSLSHIAMVFMTLTLVFMCFFKKLFATRVMSIFSTALIVAFTIFVWRTNSEYYLDVGKVGEFLVGAAPIIGCVFTGISLVTNGVSDRLQTSR